MKKKRLVYISLSLLVVLVLMDLVANLLQKPNQVDLEEERPFLLKTTWHQIGDYARFVTLDDDAGCWAAAIAQIGHFHELNPTGKIEYRTSSGARVSVDLDDFKFLHDRFVTQIEDDTSTASKEQVAKYIYYIAAVLYTDFGAHGYLDHESFIERLERHLTSTVQMYKYDKENFLRERDSIQSLVMREIDAKRPIMLYYDNGDDFGHAVALDGYAVSNDRFLVHLNMGMGGNHDGWYDLFHRITGVRDDLQTRFLITIKPVSTTE